MNKKNITIIMAGILLLALQFNIKIGAATIDVFSDIIGFALIIIGILPLAERNIMFKESRNRAIIGILMAIIGQAINMTDWGDAASTMNTIAVGLSTIFTIYFTYYFTEALILESKFQDKTATTRSFFITWSIMALLIFIHYIAFMSNISIAAIFVEAAAVICTIYFCSTVLTACKQLYMDGLPTQHM